MDIALLGIAPPVAVAIAASIALLLLSRRAAGAGVATAGEA